MQWGHHRSDFQVHTLDTDLHPPIVCVNNIISWIKWQSTNLQPSRAAGVSTLSDLHLIPSVSINFYNCTYDIFRLCRSWLSVTTAVLAQKQSQMSVEWWPASWADDPAEPVTSELSVCGGKGAMCCLRHFTWRFTTQTLYVLKQGHVICSGEYDTI